MKSLTRAECWVCSITAGVLAALVVPRDLRAEFVGSYAILFIVACVTFDVTLVILVAILKNFNDWWGW